MAEPLVSVSGVRGIVGESFTEDIVRRYTAAFARHVAEATDRARVVIGRDTRPSGEWAITLVAQTLADAGVQPVDVGVVPTPTAELAVLFHGAAGGIVITGSHNAAEWNALKFLGPDGAFLTAEDMRNIQTRAGSALPSVDDTTSQTRIKRSRDHRAIERHVQNVLATAPIDVERIRTCKFRIVLDPVNGAGALAVPALLTALNCDTAIINAEPSGIFTHPPEPTPANLASLGEHVHATEADLGFAVDPDADRLVLVDGRGDILSEEYTVTLAVLSVLERAVESASGTAKNEPATAVVNLSTTRMVDDVARRFGASVVRTAVGERHVVEGLRQFNGIVGGEGNGGVIVPRCHTGRDALVGIAVILDLLARHDTTLGDLVATLPRYVAAKEKLPRTELDKVRMEEALQRAFPDGQRSTVDGIRVDLVDGWVHVRPSNTEPVIRVIAEARTDAVLSELQAAVRSALTVPLPTTPA
jgi:phosphomannomutase